eukprot:104933-Rhodomonas_salina.1
MEQGSFFAFHGSPIENWFGILQDGLVVQSHKPGMMVNGAAHGSGIYMCMNADVCFPYSRTLLEGQHGSYVGLVVCEVLGKPEDYSAW